MRRLGVIRAIAAVALLAVFEAAGATDVVGRVVDVADARVFDGATVSFRAGQTQGPQVATDAGGFFRAPGLAKGAYVLDIQLADGRNFASRLLVSELSKTQFVEIDYSRSVSPDDEDDY